MLKSFLLTHWIVIAVLAMLVGGLAGVLTVYSDHLHSEQAALLRDQQLARERADKAADINRKEQETIHKAPAFRLLHD
ncbi:MAG: hypothetical protein EPN57_27005 [Paraburkholderia sp.]|nr:MAG: hypothetical protein EPN57_27005 [Paraburkholderia sp.]